jgi:hypothetical protein
MQLLKIETIAHGCVGMVHMILLLLHLFEISLSCYVSIWDVSIGSVIFLVFENGSIHLLHGIIIDCHAWIIGHHNLVLYNDSPSKVAIAISMMPQAWAMMLLFFTCFMLHWSSFSFLQPCGCLKGQVIVKAMHVA